MLADSTRSWVRRSLGVLTSALASLTFGSAVATGQSVVPDGPATWLVTLDGSGPDLGRLRRAIRLGATDDAHDLVAAFEQRITIDRAPFHARATALGATILRDWWIVNACHVRVEPAAVPALLADPAVVRVDRDLLAPGHGNGKPLDHFNHGAEFGFGLGLDGTSAQGAVLAIMDSGIDTDMNGIGRPHRAFFRGGDPANITPQGIGGSRIVSSQAFGALPADDPHGHGTSAAAIAAGARWGTPTATDGHAPGALIANYGIGDSIGPSGGIFAFYSTMISAWQQMLVDRATLPIVAANNSFGGEQDPLHPTQQALDAAAWAGDILVCVSAGNSGDAAQTGGQSCVNGLAVAAVAEDSHMRYAYSSRGPVVGDPTRTYPDLSAIAWGRVPIQDCETVDGLFGLTSSAAPRVAGAAAVLRAAYPTMRADEAKAVLLASAMDLQEANPAADRNAIGIGLMRQDAALVTAANPTAVADGALQTAGQSQSLGIPTQPGARYGAAVTWMRDRTTDVNWSDLDVVVYDGATMQTIATGTSPRNAYEHVTFVAPPSGSVVVEVIAMTLGTTNQEFAVAVAALPERPERGTFRVLGPGCAGPVANRDGTCVTTNDGASAVMMARPIDDVPYSSRYAHAIEATAPAGGMTVTGFELFARSLGPAELETAIYVDDGSGQPQTTPVRTGTMETTDAEQWYRTTFAPLQVPAGHRIYCGVANWSKSTIRLNPTFAPQTARLFFRDRCGGPGWHGWFFEHVGLRVLCSDTTVAAIPRHETKGPIRITEDARVECTDLPPHTPVVLALGFSRLAWAGLPLPFDLSGFGGTGCLLRVAAPLVVGTTSDGNGTARVNLRFGNGPGLLGRRVYSQFLLVDPTRPRAITVSNSGENFIGTR